VFERVGGRLELAGSARVVWGDQAKFMTLLDHLLDNAVNFRSHAWPLSVQLRLERDGGWLRGLVRDNGRGVPADQLGRIFELFRKLNAESRGRGAGLSFARKIVSLHGGRIRAEVGGQSTGLSIHFDLPLEGGVEGV